MRRCRIAVLVCVLSACAGRAPTAPSALSAPAAHATTPKFPARVTPVQGAAGVERIYAVAPSPRAPMLGASDAKVTVDVCSSFACAECAAFAATLHELHENYDELLRIVWRNCPRPADPDALRAAEAAYEVHAQRGADAFWRYHDRLFAHPGPLAPEALVALAGELEGVDVAAVRAALADRRHLARIEAEQRALTEAGVQPARLALPSTLVNGRMLAGAPPYVTLEDAVERALQELPGARVEAEAESKLAYPTAHLRHLLVQYTGARDAAPTVRRSKAEAHARAEALHDRIARGESFTRVAREESDCPTARREGALGSYSRGELPPALDLAFFTLGAGEVSTPLETEYGYHLLLRDE